MNPGADKPLFNAYVDGFNLYMGALHRRPHLRWLDLLALCAALRPDMQLNTVYYFTARLKELYPGDPSPVSQNAYLRVLKEQGIEIVYGKFRKDKRWLRLATVERAGAVEPELPRYLGLTQRALDVSGKSAAPDMPKAFVIDIEEKATDVNLASFLLRDTLTKQLEAALVISGDSDLRMAIQIAVSSGTDVKVAVPNMYQSTSEIKQVANDCVVLHPGLLETKLLCPTYISPSGKQIRRPSTWV